MSSLPLVMAFPVREGDKLLSAKAVMDRLKIHRARFHWLVRTHQFPHQTDIIQGQPKWLESVVTEWLKSPDNRAAISRRRGGR